MVKHMNFSYTCAYTDHCLLLDDLANALNAYDHSLWKLKPRKDLGQCFQRTEALTPFRIFSINPNPNCLMGHFTGS